MTLNLNTVFKENPDLAARNPHLPEHFKVLEEASPISKKAWASLDKPKRRHGKPEELFQQQIIDLAHLHGWRVAHFRTVRIQRKDGSVYYATPVQADGEGFPDLLLTRERMMVVEVKSDTGKLSEKQRIWLKAFHVAGVEWHVWSPLDWPEIEERLKR